MQKQRKAYSYGSGYDNAHIYFLYGIANSQLAMKVTFYDRHKISKHFLVSISVILLLGWLSLENINWYFKKNDVQNVRHKRIRHE